MNFNSLQQKPKQTQTAPKTATAPPQGYVLVSGPEQSSEKDTKDERPSLSATVKVALSRHIKSRDPIRVRLVGWYVLNSSAATALTQVQALSPVAVADFSSFAALYDMWRVRHVTFIFRGSSSATITGSADWGLAFDPSNLGAYNSLADLMTAKNHAGPFVLSGGLQNMSPQTTTKTGFHTLSAKLEPQRVTNDGTADNAVGGGWVGTSDTTAIVAWAKPYIPSLGAGIVGSISLYVMYDTEFKART